ncbi:MAG: hypothetical protein R2829_10235 [Bacteroidia bacterium]
MRFYDGDNIFTAPLIAKLFNRSGYGTIKASNTQGCLTFRFISNGATSDGWAAYVSTTIQPQIVFRYREHTLQIVDFYGCRW